MKVGNFSLETQDKIRMPLIFNIVFTSEVRKYKEMKAQECKLRG